MVFLYMAPDDVDKTNACGGTQAFGGIVAE
jgi:hypothetical protein